MLLFSFQTNATPSRDINVNLANVASITKFSEDSCQIRFISQQFEWANTKFDEIKNQLCSGAGFILGNDQNSEILVNIGAAAVTEYDPSLQTLRSLFHRDHNPNNNFLIQAGLSEQEARRYNGLIAKIS